MRLDLFTDRDDAGTIVYRATLVEDREMTCMTLRRFDEIINLILMVKAIDTVMIDYNAQTHIPYGHRVDQQMIHDALLFAQVSRKGRKRVVTVA